MPDPTCVISGDIVNNMVVGVYSVVFTASNIYNETAVETWTINVNASTPPTIEGITSETKNYTVGDVIEIPTTCVAIDVNPIETGVECVISGDTVDNTTVGTYTVTFTASNSYGDETVATWTINVVKEDIPDTEPDPDPEPESGSGNNVVPIIVIGAVVVAAGGAVLIVKLKK